MALLPKLICRFDPIPIQIQADVFAEIDKSGIKNIDPTEWDQIFAKNMSDEGFILNIYKQLLQLNSKKTTQF